MCVKQCLPNKKIICDKSMSHYTPLDIVMKKKTTPSTRQKLRDEKDPYKFARLELKRLKDNAKQER